MHIGGRWRPPASGPVIAVEATHLLRDVRGIGRYVRAMLPRLAAMRPEARLVLFTRKRCDVEGLVLALASEPALSGRADVLHARALTRASADVFWYPWNVTRPEPPEGATVVTIHDLAPVVVPDPRWSRWWKNLRWRRRYEATARRATVVVADSEFTAGEVCRVLGFPRGRIRVVPLAADDFPSPPAARDAETLVRLGVRRPFVLAVGAAERRKNHEILHRAMERVVAADSRVTLVVAGPWRDRDLVPPRPPWARTLGFVSDADLAVLYRTAAALVMPSTYEGFGLPVLEAMRLGAPVLCARASSLPEVAGDAAGWFDPDDETGLAAAVTRLLADESGRARMSAAGFRRAEAFTWQDTAARTLRAFDDAFRLRHGRSLWERGGEDDAGLGRARREPRWRSA